MSDLAAARIRYFSSQSNIKRSSVGSGAVSVDIDKYKDNYTELDLFGRSHPTLRVDLLQSPEELSEHHKITSCRDALILL